MPEPTDPSRQDPEPTTVDRRVVLGSTIRAMAAAGAGFAGLVACSSTSRRLSGLPDPDLPGATLATPRSRETLSWTPAPVATPASMPGVLSRSEWTGSTPRIRNVDPQKRLRYITIHHDGLQRSYSSTSKWAAKSRLELIRNAHVNHNGWADIGYHYAIDRGGRVWECRDIRYQGAHVKGQNEGNIGILVMGNFDVGRPSSAQLRSLASQVSALCAAHGISKTSRGVRSHKEWSSASTLCPGRNLQPEFVKLRDRGFRA